MVMIAAIHILTHKYMISYFLNKIHHGFTQLRVQGIMEASLENPLYVTNPTYHTNHFTLATFHQLMANSGSWFQFSREGITDTWQT